MPTTAIMWFRRDLRVHDLPALAGAAKADRIVPVFVFDERLLLKKARFPSAKRIAFMVGCLEALDGELRERGAKLCVRTGQPEKEIPKLAEEVNADEVWFTLDASPWSRKRDKRVKEQLESNDVEVHATRGAFVTDDPSQILTGQDKPYTVFTPFSRTWDHVTRREKATTPRTLHMPSGVKVGDWPSRAALGIDDVGLAFEPGEAAARKALTAFLRAPVEDYEKLHDHAAGGTSRLSAYLRWGCLSPIEVEEKANAKGGEGADAFVRQLAWRDFYASVLIHFPEVVKHEFQEKYRDLEWHRKTKKFDAWKEGRTGYPFVDAGMRQLLEEGFMHNRVRMVVGSFLTKDLHMDWRHGEAHFMEHLIDGDMAANNGNWQWIASVGVDPKPYFQRLFNPVLQQQKFDPDGEYVRRWVPELSDVPDERLAEPWAMSDDEQSEAGCVIGEDYPEPIVDHAEERKVAQDRYRSAGGSD